ncbi:GNAT family N-acetyltransferase [Conyzicola sp.]|uniref:GNAT family N-acetyltransferase n=1 Tax=Conyzicola sp. TaxID=1969404 RepID=UPI003989DE02
MVDYVFGPVRADDTKQIVDLVRSSFDESRAPFLAYAQPGMAAHLAVAVTHPAATPDRVLVSARAVGDDRLLGFADFRVLGDGVGFLSYVAVDESARGEGIATALISEFLAARPHIVTMKLDVFRDNEPARRLYARLGYEHESTSAWATRPVPSGGSEPQVAGLPNALAAYSAYGFCELAVATASTSATVGLLGPSILNARSLTAFLDDDLLAGVATMFPDLSTVFVSVPEAALTEITVHYRLEGLSDRMSLAVPGRTPRGSAS